MEWINLILERFWTVFEPELSRQVIQKANIIMKEQKPGFLDKLELKEFTLGSTAPCILGARGYPKTLSNVIHFDLDLCFYPSEISEESRQTIIRMRPSFAEEQPVMWNSKIVVVARLGKGFVGVDVPVMVKEISFFGKLRVQLELMNDMPLLKQVQISFLETPKIDFILRPLKAIDLMDLPGLSNWMMSMINDNIEAQLVNPNRITINVAGTIEKLRTGVLKVKIAGTQGVDFGQGAEPFIRLELNGKSRGKTARALEGAAIHGRMFILTRALTKPLIFHVMRSPTEEIGTASYPLEALSEQMKLENLTADITSPEGKVVGQVMFNLAYATADDVLDPEADLNSETGVFSIGIQRGEKLLPVGKGERKVYVEGWVHSKKIEHDPATPYTDTDPNCYRFGAVEMRPKEPAVWEGEPEWEVYMERVSKTQITLMVRDAETDEVYGRWTAPVKKLLNRSDWFGIGPDGRIKLAFAFRPTDDRSGGGAGDELIVSEPSIGVARLKILGANGLEDKKAYYATLERKDTEVEIGRTGKSQESAAPVWNKTIVWPIAAVNEVARMEIYAKDIFKDPMVAALDIPIAEYAEKHPNEIVMKTESLKDKKDALMTDGEVIRYEMSFFPVTISEARQALEASGTEYPLMPADMPSGSNCVLLALEEISVKGVGLGHQPKDLFIEAQLEDDDEPLVRTAKDTAAHNDGRFTWSMYAETFVKEPAEQKLVIRLREDKTIGTAENLAVVTVDLSDAQAGHWYRTKSGIEVMIKATCKPLRLTLPTEAENQGVLKVHLKEAHNLLAVDAGGTSDPFAVFRLNSNKVYKTEVVKKSLDPVFDETMEVEVYHRDRDVLNIDFRDWNRVAVSRTLGQINLDLSALPVGEWQEMDVPLENTSTGNAILRVRFDQQKNKARSAMGAVVAAPGNIASGVASGVSSGAKAVFSPMGKLMKRSSTDSDNEDKASVAEKGEKEKSKVGSFFSSVGDKMTGKKDASETAPQPSAGPKKAAVATGAAAATAVATAAAAASNDNPVLFIQFLDIRVTGVSKPFDSRIKVRQEEKTIFKTDELKGTLTPSFRNKPLTETAFLLPDPDPAKPIRFALHWSVKSEPAVPELVFDPEAMKVVEEKEDSAIASMPFVINTAGVKAEVLFKFGEASEAVIKSLGHTKGLFGIKK